MARPKRIRRVTNPPHFKGFKPMGILTKNPPVVLNYEEYEAIRLNDFELFGQAEASQIMGVSRPTYTRIYESARRKVALAFVKGQPIVFEGGKVYFDSEWYRCNECGCYFNHPQKETEVISCALCNSKNIEHYMKGDEECGIEDICVCPQCGREISHVNGTPCRKELCPDCKCSMIRKGYLINSNQ